MTPVEILQKLIRFDTTNPPGNERACIEWVDGLLRDAGLETTIASADPERPNLIARLPGEGSAPPLLLQGHVDVVTVAGQKWSKDPFGGELANGFVWGRGALDMKAGVAMMISAVLRAANESLRPAGDLILCVLSDEEAGGDQGAAYLARERPELFEGVKYAIGEFGGFSLEVAGKRFYPIQVDEKRLCWMKATVRGPGGHGSLPMRGGTMARLGELMRTLDRKRLPVHITPTTRRMVDGVADGLGLPLGLVLKRLLDPPLTDRMLDLLGDRGSFFDPLLHNTVNATIVNGGDKVNVIPSEVSVGMDARLLPGQTIEDLESELKATLGDDIEFEIDRMEPGPPEPDFGLFDLLADVLREADPGGTPIPMLLPGVTDARHFGQLGIQGYGFTPMKLPKDFRFMELIHAADERIPAEAVEFGADATFHVLERYGR